MGYVYLFFAIVAEIIGTSALKASHQFTKLVPSIIVFIGYPPLASTSHSSITAFVYMPMPLCTFCLNICSNGSESI